MEFIVNSKVYVVTKISLFTENCRRKLHIEVDVRQKGKVEKVTEFVKSFYLFSFSFIFIFGFSFYFLYFGLRQRV